MKKNATAIVVLNWNGGADTVACLESLVALRASDFSIYVVDNDSRDDSLSHIRQWLAAYALRSDARFAFVDLASGSPDPRRPVAPEAVGHITLVQAGRNGGYAAGNNVGLTLAMQAGFDYFWILNNDTEVDAGALTALRQRMADAPQIGICGSTLLYAHDRTRVQARGGAAFIALKGRGIPIDAFQTTADAFDVGAIEQRLRYVIGASMFVRREFIAKVGLMAEDYFLYWEEIDWATRGRPEFALGYAADSLVFHKVGASIGTSDSGASSPLSEFYMARGRLRYCLRYSRVSVPFVLFESARSILRWVAKADWPRAWSLARAVTGRPYVR
ncbi:MAG: glycosyltransferase family 2 protein [Comamonadaceae bacterium]|nr:MAG: glycosyltransferase family 2 protein [Comamonadaceae bacterium]